MGQMDSVGALRCLNPDCRDGLVTVLSGPINGDPWPSDTTREEPCEECRGTGVARCWYCMDAPATGLDVRSERPICATCDEEEKAATCEGAAERSGK